MLFPNIKTSQQTGLSKGEGIPQVETNRRLGDDSHFFHALINRESIPHAGVFGCGLSSLTLMLNIASQCNGAERWRSL